MSSFFLDCIRLISRIIYIINIYMGIPKGIMSFGGEFERQRLSKKESESDASRHKSAVIWGFQRASCPLVESLRGNASQRRNLRGNASQLKIKNTSFKIRYLSYSGKYSRRTERSCLGSSGFVI